HEMLHMEDSAMRAVQTTHKYLHMHIYAIPRITVFKEKMLDVARRGFAAGSELANMLVREYGLDYHGAHDVVNKFVRAAEKAGIPANESKGAMLDEAAMEVLGRPLGMSD